MKRPTKITPIIIYEAISNYIELTMSSRLQKNYTPLFTSPIF